MNDPEDVLLSCSKWQEMFGAYDAIRSALTLEVRSRVKDIMNSYMLRFGPQGMYERMNNRTIRQILAEFLPGEAKVIASGEKDGVRWTLYDAPEPDGDKKTGRRT